MLLDGYSATTSDIVCAAGPVLLEDYPILEKVATFDREKIPDRVVHARGAVAKGYFEVPSLLQFRSSPITSEAILTMRACLFYSDHVSQALLHWKHQHSWQHHAGDR